MYIHFQNIFSFNFNSFFNHCEMNVHFFETKEEIFIYSCAILIRSNVLFSSFTEQHRLD